MMSDAVLVACVFLMTLFHELSTCSCSWVGMCMLQMVRYLSIGG
jgi:hypothetical protein